MPPSYSTMSVISLSYSAMSLSFSALSLSYGALSQSYGALSLSYGATRVFTLQTEVTPLLQANGKTSKKV